jgi:hypothetical protein
MDFPIVMFYYAVKEKEKSVVVIIGNTINSKKAVKTEIKSEIK